MPFLMSLQDGTQRIVRAIEKKKSFSAFPLRFYLSIRVLNMLPYFLREKIINSVYKE